MGTGGRMPGGMVAGLLKAIVCASLRPVSIAN